MNAFPLVLNPGDHLLLPVSDPRAVDGCRGPTFPSNRASARSLPGRDLMGGNATVHAGPGRSGSSVVSAGEFLGSLPPRLWRGSRLTMSQLRLSPFPQDENGRGPAGLREGPAVAA